MPSVNSYRFGVLYLFNGIRLLVSFMGSRRLRPLRLLLLLGIFRRASFELFNAVCEAFVLPLQLLVCRSDLSQFVFELADFFLLPLDRLLQVSQFSKELLFVFLSALL